ncbi:heme ABC transporter ATP-binding protein [Umezawaea endophytica]|uniref:Heme ABC transporter ATP-binding protein n=1 Tax=Umezawaea endophytica TaxID=1654476 RepID=A0A9X2VF52_9PSEU|nr:heme ABC transporter ATP-binding protein [Umezawaea endophytica]MCS7475339.1 heme ABC transporter ATP-binding protein [Umezawaea endophytica]
MSVRAHEVSVVVDGKSLLDSVSLALEAGEVLALVGPNGAGKSTLLDVLAGDRKPDGGAVELCGKPLRGWSTLEQARRRAVLPQQNSVAFPFTCAEVVRMGRAPWEGTDADQHDDVEVATAFELTGTAGFADRPFTSLSGGERALVALARVLAQRTDVLLLDEPTAALDLRHQERVLGIARERADDGCGVLAVLHDLGLAAAHADRIAVLAGGSLAAVGVPAEICTADLLSEVYQHPVEVFPHPRTGRPVVLPHREENRR